MRSLLGRISRLEVAAGALVALVLAVLIVIEPGILGAPFENRNTMLFTSGVTLLAAAALLLMLRWEVPAPLRLTIVAVPMVAVSWWLLSPFFTDRVADDDFETTIAAAQADADATARPPANDDTPVPDASGQVAPVLLGSGTFKGLAGHDGTGDAGLFRLGDGRVALRFENFDIDNGPDLRLYLVPGADRTDRGAGSVSLGKLKGNVGDQTYDLPADVPLSSSPAWTVLVWCEAFSVEFVAATLHLPGPASQ